jgi:endoglucanase
MPLLNAPLSSSCASILNAAGEPVRLAGVNWGGAQQDNLVPAGLDKLDRSEIARRIIAMGFNHVRMPFSVGTFMTSSAGLKTGPVPVPSTLAANPDLAGLSPWEVYQACVETLTSAGLAVIPNQMLLFPGWCCSQADCNGLWYNGSWPASTFTACWELVVTAFAGNPLVIGYDLHNEPRPATVGGTLLTPSWGDGNTATDMRLLYRNTIAALQAIDPASLWFCEGLNFAADLTKAGAHPVGIGGTVYSMHDYSWFSHPDGQSQSAYFTQMDANGGYIPVSGQAPLWLGEIGTNTDAATATLDSGWFANLLAWIAARNVHWCWWELSAQMVKGTVPTTNTVGASEGQREPYGLLAGQDWLGTQQQILDRLQPIM